ncbi:hypothetical protein G7Y89_g392 [Cudoniella acicularis]|uniref:DNA-binding protein RAP1 n=1 Tax=Cudoniella acicularis TaxID=354080 RepID=A0A8H4RYX4_9HELO|nr:hypothetical protein G7Y89_g392 [Cudoniella acicularis]
MARVVYEGVGGGGDLFEGQTFFLLQRVPQRNTWLERIEANGGEITKIEKNADIIIADHVRQDAPSGSVSWTYIDRSVRNGRLENVEDHLAGPPVGTVREAGSGQPVKRGKTPFTAEDDRILTEWVARAERKGVAIRGNELYKQLAAKVIAKFHGGIDGLSMCQGNHGLGFLATTTTTTTTMMKRTKKTKPLHLPPPESPPKTITRKPAPRVLAPTSSSRLPERSKAAKVSPQKKASQKAASFKPTRDGPSSTQDNSFSEEEVQLLLDNYDDIINVSEDKIIDAWLHWALEFPTHSAQEWYNFFKKEILPMRQPMGPGVKEAAIAPPAAIPASEPPAQAGPSNQVLKKVLEVKDSQDSSGKALSSQNADNKVEDATMVDEEQFREDLTDMAQELSLEVEFNPEICGRRIPLFRLWQVVRSSQFGGFDQVNGRKLWPKVARELNFNDYQHSTAANDLKICYGEILADFETSRDEYINNYAGLTDSQENALLEAQLLQTAARETQNGNETMVDEEEDDIDDDLNHPLSSPPQPFSASSSKRSFGPDVTNSGSTRNKRQKIDKGKGRELEIPSTPSDVLNGTTAPFSGGKSSRKANTLYSAPVRQSDFSASPGLPRHPRWEPETQDFQFGLSQNGHNKSDPIDLSSSPDPKALTRRNGNEQPTTQANDNHEPHDSFSTQSTREKTQLKDAIQECIDY